MLVKYKKSNILEHADIKFYPGLNSVDDKKWEEAKKHPAYEYMVNEDYFDEIGKAGVKDDYKALKTMKPNEAKKIVNETVRIELLNGWLKNETRADVKKALLARIDLMEAPPVLRSNTDDNSDLEDQN
jgi:hypothetical protein